MIYGKMWLVVKPTVGIPLFFAGVATASLLIHGAVLLNTTWYPAFYQGNAKPKAMGELSPGGGSAPVVALLK